MHDERIVSDPSYPNLVEAVLQLWWAQRGFIYSIRHEKDELRRFRLVHIDQFDDYIDEMDTIVETQINSLSLWENPRC